MSNQAKPPEVKKPDYTGGLRDVRTTGVFRAVNFELFAKPNKYIMAFGLVTISGCVAYLAYLNAQAQNQQEATYIAITEDGTERTAVKKSKWDF